MSCSWYRVILFHQVAAVRYALLMIFSVAFVSNGYAQPPEVDEQLNHPVECGFQSKDIVRELFQRAIENGEVPDPKTKILPVVKRRLIAGASVAGGALSAVTQHDLFYHEDTLRILTTDFSDAQLFGLLYNATNEVLVEHGDNFDFVGFFLNFAPHHKRGSAFYLPIENDVSGIGDSLFNVRSTFGIAGSQVEGLVMMWNHTDWAPGSNNRTQLVLGQEFEHRFAMFLDPISGNRRLQGLNDSCGRSDHWNFKVDGQGSGMEIAEWVGFSPAIRPDGNLSVNTDIGGVFSYPDLYLMGYITPDELDTLPSELRYMDNSSDCSADYSGTISTWDSSDIIISNGVRVPEAEFAQKNFRTAWVVVHLPEAPPTSSELDRIVDILNDWKDSWQVGTLGRGTMDNTLDVPFRMTFVDEIPSELTPGQDVTIRIQTINLSDSSNENSGLLHFSINGEAYQTTPLISKVNNVFKVTIPALACSSIIDFYVTIESNDGRIIQSPRAAPSTVYTAVSTMSSSIIFEDDFNTDQGWTVSDSVGLTDGSWNRDVPMGVGDRGDPTADYDGSGMCFLTNSLAGNTDIDNGSTTLLSPVFDLSAEFDVILRYARWYINDVGSDPGGDDWIVEVTDDGSTWVELENSNISNAWDEKTFRLGDFITLSNQVQFRFIASDLNPGGIVEAAVDAFRLTSIDCNGNICNLLDPVQPEPAGVDKSRFISFVPGNSGIQSAIRVVLKELDMFSGSNNEIRWVGPPQEFLEGAGSQATFMASRLQCSPNYQDWGSLALLHVYGTEIVPSSLYDVQMIADNCGIFQESYFSASLFPSTGKWCDLAEPFDNGQFQQPDIVDVLGAVDKFLGFTHPIKALSKVQPNLINPSDSVGIAEVIDVVDAFLGVTYPFAGPEPCP